MTPLRSIEVAKIQRKDPAPLLVKSFQQDPTTPAKAGVHGAARQLHLASTLAASTLALVSVMAVPKITLTGQWLLSLAPERLYSVLERGQGEFRA